MSKLSNMLRSLADASEKKCGVSCSCVSKGQSFFPAYFRCLADRMTLVPQEMRTFVKRTRELSWTMGEIGAFSRRTGLFAAVGGCVGMMFGSGDFMNVGRPGAANAYLAEKK